MIKEISSLQNPLIKHLVKLREDRAYRHECGSVLLSGTKMIRELSSYSFLTLLVEIDTPIPSWAKADRVVYVTAAILKKVTGLAHPESLAAEISLPTPPSVASAPFLLILDGVSDPGNLGTLLRTAQGLGWDGVFITEGSVDPLHEKALRAAKGATFTLPWQQGTLNALLQERQGTLLLADARGPSPTPLSPPLALILGNEAHGASIPPGATLVGIPLTPSTESLNVAVAGAILMYHIKMIL